MKKNSKSPNSIKRNSYRIGSVGFDTQLCLWDISDDILNYSAENSINELKTTSSNFLPQTIFNKNNNNKGNLTNTPNALSKITNHNDVCFT